VPKNDGKENVIMRERLKNKKGFTLAELLIVVAIIAILMAIMIPVFGSSRANAILAKDAANLRSIFSEAVTSEMADDSHYNTKGILLVDLNSYIDKSDVKFDSGTSAKYEMTMDASGVPTANGKIVITHAKAGDNKEEIVIDKDMKLVTRSSGSTKQVDNGSSIKLPTK